MAIGTITVTIYNRSWSSQGTIDSAFLPYGRFMRNDVGEGGFVFPIYDTPAKTLIQYNRIAVVTVEEDGAATSVVAAFHIHSIQPKYVKSGDYDGYVVEVSGPGILAELQWDNIGYNTISNGSQGPTSNWASDIVAFAQESWSFNTMGTVSGPTSAYLQAAGESVWDALIECAAQIGVSLAYAPYFATQTTGTLGREILYIGSPLSGSAIFDWDILNIVQTNPTGDEVQVLNLKVIEDSNEIATRVTIYGAGIGADALTIGDAEGLVTVPSGFSVDWDNSIITNTTLEAVSDQPVVHRLHQVAHIKPEDNSNTTASQTAAIQLFWAGIAFLQDRDSDRRQFYEVSFIGNGGYNYTVGQLANLVYTENSPIDAAGASNTTAVISINDDFVVHEMHIQVPNSGKHKGNRLITVILGEQITSDDYVRPLPSDGDVVIKKLKEHDEVLRHATASYSPDAPGGTPTYATADAPFVVISNTTNLTAERAITAGTGISLTDGGVNSTITINNTGQTSQIDNLAYVTIGNTASLSAERALTAGDGLDLTDGGANSTVTLAVDVTDIIGNGLTETTNNIVLGTPTTLTVSTTNNVGASTHSHAITTSSAVSTATAVILATDSGGRLRLKGLAVGQAADSDQFKITSDGSSPCIVVTAGTEGEIATPDGESIRWGHWNSGTATFTERMQMDGNGSVLIGTSSSSATAVEGLVIDQGTRDDHISEYHSTDVTHLMTGIAPATCYGWLEKAEVSNGALNVGGMGADRLGLVLSGYGTTDTTGKASTSNAYVETRAFKRSGTGSTAPGTDANVFLVKSGTTNVAIFAEDGDLYLDTVTNENHWDAYNDVAILHGLRAGMMPEGHELRERFGEFISEAREILERYGIVHYNDDGHNYVAMKGLQMLTIDAVRQMYERIDERLTALENTNV